MDAIQYKDYGLSLLFIKYISDKYAGVREVSKGSSFADMANLKGTGDIGAGSTRISSLPWLRPTTSFPHQILKESVSLGLGWRGHYGNIFYRMDRATWNPVTGCVILSP